MSKRDWAVAVTIALCAIGLVACGGGGSDSSGSSGSGELSEAELEEGRVEMSECLREHGLDVPDPVPGEQGLTLQKSSKGGGGGGVNLDDPATKEALEACEEEVDFRPPEPTPEEQEEMKENMLAFAQCMREHGVDMPDPEFGEGGKVTMRIGGPAGSKLDQPAMEAAQEACQEEMPDGGIGFKAGP